jgi:hypothetical protein
MWNHFNAGMDKNKIKYICDVDPEDENEQIKDFPILEALDKPPRPGMCSSTIYNAKYMRSLSLIKKPTKLNRYIAMAQIFLDRVLESVKLGFEDAKGIRKKEWKFFEYQKKRRKRKFENDN